jgi:serine/threonine-protein kinase
LVAGAYFESYLRALRRGRNRLSASAGLPLAACGLAAAVVGGAWVVLGREPTTATLFGSGVLAAAAGMAATLGALRIGRTYRYRRTRHHRPAPR